jgi:hypothetical protein
MSDQERRLMPRYYLVSRVDVLVAGSADPLWGAIANISRTGTTLYIRQTLKPRCKATLRFRFQAAGGREVIEDVSATLVWQRGETAGMDFEAPMLAGSPAAQKCPQLANYIAEKEATGGK